MDKSKLLVGLLVVAVLFIVVMVFRWVTADDTQRPFFEMLQIQNTVNELSDMATDQGRAETRQIAASVRNTTTSDRAELGRVYVNVYQQSTPESVREEYIQELDDTSEGFDDVYRELAIELLEASQNQMQQLAPEFTGAESIRIFERSNQNHEEQLERIRAASE